MNRAELKANQMVQVNGGRMFTVFGEKGDCPTSESYEKNIGVIMSVIKKNQLFCG